MKRALLSQMTREWKTNIWFIIELSIVLLSICVIISVLWIKGQGLFKPRGFTPDDVYNVEVTAIPKSSPYFLPEFADNYYVDRDELIRRLQENPNVEFVALHNNFLPYNFSYMGNTFQIEGLPDSIMYLGNYRIGQPDMIRILDVKSTTGKTSDELVAMLERGEILLSHNEEFERIAGPIDKYIGKKAFPRGDLNQPKRIGDIVQIIRRNDYEAHSGGMLIQNYDTNENSWGEIAIKVKPGKGKTFEYDFNNDPALSKLRNVNLINLKSLTSLGSSVHRKTDITFRVLSSIGLFLLITIFLGLFGSFWFRVQQRTSEIAIRRTCGATDRDIFRRIIGEGLILLAGGLILASACVWPFIRDITDITGEQWYIYLIIELITAALMAIGIILSLSYPAYRAMHIEPAIAVKEE